ncbi:hypothetical protein C7974DRAFT_377127 [Boeremia exigua]|uniref:uncharacterized protein n=1 Tax=Boeremia exigua TaxID=749465 RepID=UPI001E8D3EF9|nr:uncharacterized protein C7974DRAFT_377127 [Boeremia exigua]KAH6625638.1 hypothetical protein C7974DRAFT_377127 [Boeremia exigua]
MVEIIKNLIPAEYGYVLGAVVGTFFVGVWHGARVGGFRKAAKVPYPFEYASYEQVQTAAPASKKAMLAFNSAQRAHQNFNENHPTIIGTILISGLRWPVATAVLGAVWSAMRVVYAIGYTSSSEDGGKGRYYGILWLLAHHSLLLMSGYTAYKIAAA